MRGPVPLQLLRNLRHQRVVGVGVAQQGRDGQQHLGDSERRRPLVLEDVKADAAVRVYLRAFGYMCAVAFLSPPLPRRASLRIVVRGSAQCCRGTGGQRTSAPGSRTLQW